MALAVKTALSRSEASVMFVLPLSQSTAEDPTEAGGPGWGGSQ